MAIINNPFGAIFEKVSYEQYKKDFLKLSACSIPCNEDVLDTFIKKIYDNIKLPTRSTDGSAGYDFKMPFGITLHRWAKIVIPTGIRCKLGSDKVLSIYPRSGQGFKYRLAICNTVGIIDSDYYNSDNEGHIMIKLCYDGADNLVVPELSPEDFRENNDDLVIMRTHRKAAMTESIKFKAGDGFAQGVITKYYITYSDDVTAKRNGGFGSTDNTKFNDSTTNTQSTTTNYYTTYGENETIIRNGGISSNNK